LPGGNDCFLSVYPRIQRICQASLWLALAALSAAWLALLPLYGPVSWHGVLWLGIGVALAVVGLMRRDLKDPLVLPSLALGPLLLCVAFLPWPYRSGPLLVALAVVAGRLARRFGRGAGLAWGLFVAGGILGLQALAVPLYLAVAARAHSWPAAAALGGAALSLVHVPYAVGLMVVEVGSGVFNQ